MMPLQQIEPGRTNASSHCTKISHLSTKAAVGKKVMLDEGNKSQHVRSTYGGTRYLMPKGELKLFAGLFHAIIFSV